MRIQTTILDADFRITGISGELFAGEPLDVVRGHRAYEFNEKWVREGTHRLIQKYIDGDLNTAFGMFGETEEVAIVSLYRSDGAVFGLGTVFTGHVASLTPRERQVLWLLGSQPHIRSLADSLDVSKHTIYVHLRSIANKLDLPHEELPLLPSFIQCSGISFERFELACQPGKWFQP
ncbi:MAG: helix-turn-helix transcriptional regulator [Planctomycetota bacterium]